MCACSRYHTSFCVLTSVRICPFREGISPAFRGHLGFTFLESAPHRGLPQARVAHHARGPRRRVRPLIELCQLSHARTNEKIDIWPHPPSWYNANAAAQQLSVADVCSRVMKSHADRLAGTVEIPYIAEHS